MMIFRPMRLSIAGLIAGVMVTVSAQGLRVPGAAGAAAASANAPQRASDYIVAVVNSEPITNLQVRQEMQRLGQQLAQLQQPVPPTEQLAERALEQLIIERSQIQYAREIGIKIEDFALDEAQAAVARQNQVDIDEMYRQLQETGISRIQFRNNLRDQLMLARVRDREVGQRIRISELDIDQYLIDQQRDANNAIAEVNIAHILVALPESPTSEQLAQAQAKAQQVMDRARAGQDFAALARETSQAPDAADGGMFGLRSLDRYPLLFTDAVRNLQPGAMTIVRSGAGLHVLKLLEKRLAGAPATSVVQTRASHILLRATDSQSEAAAITRQEDFRRRLVAGQADFAALAREHSQDPSAAQGGDLGWAVPGQFVPEFERALESLAPGEISQPLVSRFGVHLIRLAERRIVPLSERERREAVRAVLRDKKYDEAYLNWSSELRARAYVDRREPPG